MAPTPDEVSMRLMTYHQQLADLKDLLHRLADLSARYLAESTLSGSDSLPQAQKDLERTLREVQLFLLRAAQHD